jgi:hypothetical protein
MRFTGYKRGIISSDWARLGLRNVCDVSAQGIYLLRLIEVKKAIKSTLDVTNQKIRFPASNLQNFTA